MVRLGVWDAKELRISLIEKGVSLTVLDSSYEENFVILLLHMWKISLREVKPGFKVSYEFEPKVYDLATVTHCFLGNDRIIL